EVREARRRGESYQANYTLRLRASFEGDDYAYYTRLCAAQHQGLFAYLRLESVRILSASPELFFHLKDGRLLTRPMKGTAARGRWTEEDADRAEWLANSAKNRAENLTIVDLLRNDLG